MATKVRLLRAQLRTEVSAVMPAAAATASAPAPTVATPTGTRVRLLRAQARTDLTGGIRVRLLRAQIRTEPNLQAVRVRLLRAQIMTIQAATPVQVTVVPVPAECEPGDSIVVTATGTPGASYNWAITSGSAPGTLTPLTPFGPQARLVPDLNLTDGPLNIGVQVVATLAGYPDSVASVDIPIWPVVTFILRAGPPLSWQPRIAYRS